MIKHVNVVVFRFSVVAVVASIQQVLIMRSKNILAI